MSSNNLAQLNNHKLQLNENETEDKEEDSICETFRAKPSWLTENETEDKEEDTTCGTFGVKPSWLQVLASKKTYVLVYGSLGMNQSAIGTYFIGTLSTIEKRFQIPSTKTGLIACAWDIGALCSSIIMAYFGSTGHKTRWVALGAVVAAFSCFIRFIPHAIYGPGDPPLSTADYNSRSLCNATTEMEEVCTLESDAFITFIIFFIAHILLGIGTCTYYTLGIAYLDDNSLKNKIPFLFALSTSLRGVGPTLGFLLASYALKININPSVKPAFENEDPRWIGAWWYGWIPLGITHLGFSFIMSCFPKTLPREAMRRKSSGAHWTREKSKKSFSDFMLTMKRLVKNPILMFNSFSTTFYVFGMMAYWIFIPKYMESQFRISASKASFISGTIGLACMGLGVLTSGAVVSKFRPRPRYLAAWNVFTETVDTVGHLLFAFLGCPKFDLHGNYNSEGSWNLTTSCNSGCDCPLSLQYNPVCSSDETTTFYSPCHAGCINSTIINDTKVYTNCSCINEGMGWAKEGQCPVDCFNQFLIFLILLSTMKFLSSTGRAGNTIIQFRSVNPKDKSISIALTEALLCIVAFIPAPILYGYLLDYSCLVWGYSCGSTGNCWLYEGKIMRYLLNFTASSFLLIATLFDVGVLCKIGNLQIYDDDDEVKKDKEMQEPSDKYKHAGTQEGNHVHDPLLLQNNHNVT